MGHQDKLDLLVAQSLEVHGIKWTKCFDTGMLYYLCPKCYVKCIVECCSTCKIWSAREQAIFKAMFSEAT